MAPGSKKKKTKKKGLKGCPVDKLPDDILTDIISRVPYNYKSTCCCKCVSTRWRDLFSHPDHRKKLPQPLAGFFHEGYNPDRFPDTARYFTNVSGKGYAFINPSLSFLPRYESLDILDCCNGLLLCRCWKPTDPKTLDYVVCNPATEKWVVVPATCWSTEVKIARLGFEPGVSSHFHVFEFINDETCAIDEDDEDPLSDFDGHIAMVAIYSSKTGVWTERSVDSVEIVIPWDSRSVFLNGILHLACDYNLVAAFDVEGNNRWLFFIPSQPNDPDFVNDVFPSQGRLYLANSTAGSCGSRLSVWVLEDYDSEKWTLKHEVRNSKLFGAKYSSFANYRVISFHPERNMIFIVCGRRNTLMSYEMDSRKLCFIRELGPDCQIGPEKSAYLAYVPLYSESLADGH